MTGALPLPLKTKRLSKLEIGSIKSGNFLLARLKNSYDIYGLICGNLTAI